MPKLIAFRPDAELGSKFDERVETLGVTDSELGRRAVAKGLDAASHEIAEEKRKAAKELIERLTPRKGTKLPFEHPLAPTAIENTMALCDSRGRGDPDGRVAQLIEHRDGIAGVGSLSLPTSTNFKSDAVSVRSVYELSGSPDAGRSGGRPTQNFCHAQAGY